MGEGSLTMIGLQVLRIVLPRELGVGDASYKT